MDTLVVVFCVLSDVHAVSKFVEEGGGWSCSVYLKKEWGLCVCGVACACLFLFRFVVVFGRTHPKNQYLKRDTHMHRHMRW